MIPIGLRTETPESWAVHVMDRKHLPAFVADHAVCELQATVQALSLVGSYPRNAALVDQLSALAAEELRHFRRVAREARRLGAPMRTTRRNFYVAELRASCRREREPEKCLDLLLVAALIEERSRERFERLHGHVTDARLSRLYDELADAEARHGPIYLGLAIAHAGEEVASRRLDELLDVEARALAHPPKVEIAVHGAA